MHAFPSPIKSVLVLGGGSAGLIAAATLKRRLPFLTVRVLRSPELGVIGVGEGTTITFPQHFFHYLRLSPKQFYQEAEPIWKLGIRFKWGTGEDFYYAFVSEHDQKMPDLSRNVGFYQTSETSFMGPISACMHHGNVFPKRPDNTPEFNTPHGYHVENAKLVRWLEQLCVKLGIEIRDGLVTGVTKGERGVESLTLETGESVSANLYMDASGFRSELLGRAMEEPFISFERSLFCDRAVISGWPRGAEEPILPYTTAETMNSGWCWRIDHEHWINRGYVYASAFISDEEALSEFLAKNPKVANEPRMVRFRSGRRARTWVGNVVGIGNACGFVEPLEATALSVICVETRTLADSLLDSECAPPPTIVALYNTLNTNSWEDIRDFLAVHYAFNHRLDTPFWKACREETDLGGALPVVEFYRENGPSALGENVLLRPTNSFKMSGYLALLCGQQVPHRKAHSPSPSDAKRWSEYLRQYESIGRSAFPPERCLALVRSPGMRWQS